MNVRIISGEFGGRKIKAPTGDLTHPMSERVRGSIFNILGKKIVDARTLDAFAGTGSLGIESLSRGASFAVFLERDRVASSILNENIEILGIGDRTKSYQIGVTTWFLKNQEARFDIIFADPPYNDLQYSAIIKLSSLLDKDGIILLSHPKNSKLPSFDDLTFIENRNYGNAEIAIWKKN